MDRKWFEFVDVDIYQEIDYKHLIMLDYLLHKDQILILVEYNNYKENTLCLHYQDKDYSFDLQMVLDKHYKNCKGLDFELNRNLIQFQEKDMNWQKEWCMNFQSYIVKGSFDILDLSLLDKKMKELEAEVEQKQNQKFAGLDKLVQNLMEDQVKLFDYMNLSILNFDQLQEVEMDNIAVKWVVDCQQYLNLCLADLAKKIPQCLNSYYLEDFVQNKLYYFWKLGYYLNWNLLQEYLFVTYSTELKLQEAKIILKNQQQCFYLKIHLNQMFLLFHRQQYFLNQQSNYCYQLLGLHFHLLDYNFHQDYQHFH